MRLSFRSLAFLPLAAALVAGVACSDSDATKRESAAEQATAPAAASKAAEQPTTVPFAAPSQQSGAAARASTPELVKRVRPSVVRVQAGSGQGLGTGTGFIIDERGYIVTNNHVVTAGTGRVATTLKVDLADGRTLDAKLIGRDERTDIAVLKIEASNLTPLRFADPSGIEVGEDVVAVGFALDLGGQPTVTKGVVSALERTIEEQGSDGSLISISGAIQTDAAINPGNSGGPLLDTDGNVLGINTAGLRGGSAQPVQGISFAVSSPVAQPIVKALMEDGAVRRGYLGVTVSGVDRQRSEALNLRVNAGARIERVEPSSAAAQAGLRQGDVLVKVGDVDINNVGDLTRALTHNGPGKKVKVEFVRDGQRQSVELTPGERPSGT